MRSSYWVAGVFPGQDRNLLRTTVYGQVVHDLEGAFIRGQAGKRAALVLGDCHRQSPRDVFTLSQTSRPAAPPPCHSVLSQLKGLSSVRLLNSVELRRFAGPEKDAQSSKRYNCVAAAG